MAGTYSFSAMLYDKKAGFFDKAWTITMYTIINGYWGAAKERSRMLCECCLYGTEGSEHGEPTPVYFLKVLLAFYLIEERRVAYFQT